eukprot:CAMPEP_0178455586 /NCGR_PEP_ID=MMETSP0689_2-20121128/45991_1 /TAXON_ID=160604 /ORGANISM="Amphidinium massartii, Strain CS-259" /LENGTH=715 /DNA_ID=CAMNT_0020081637 /DNA_START=112 /DNA_END=2259 /DNA_ORIENTATION=-
MQDDEKREEASAAAGSQWSGFCYLPLQQVGADTEHSAVIMKLHVGSPVELRPQIVGPAAKFSVTPALPAGLQLDEASGIISGIPGETSPVQSYLVSAWPPNAEVKTGAAPACTQLKFHVTVGKIYTVAGSREEGHITATAAQPAPALQQRLSFPTGFCVGSNGVLYVGLRTCIAEFHQETGMLKPLLGKPGFPGSNGDGVHKDDATVEWVCGMVIHSNRLYFADLKQHVVRKVGLRGSPSEGVVLGVAGSAGQGGSAGDGGPAVSATLQSPTGLAVVGGSEGLGFKLAIATVSGIRIVDLATGIITTAFHSNSSRRSAAEQAAMPVPDEQLSWPRHLLAVGARLYFADQLTDSIRCINFRRSRAVVENFAGGGSLTCDGAAARLRRLSGPCGLALTPDGSTMFVTCIESAKVLAIDMEDPDHSTWLVAGGGSKGSSADFIEATTSSLKHPRAVVVSRGNLFIAEDHCVRCIALEVVTSLPTGMCKDWQLTNLAQRSTFLGAWSTFSPSGLVSPFSMPSGRLFLAPSCPPAADQFKFVVGFPARDGSPPFVIGIASLRSLRRAFLMSNGGVDATPGRAFVGAGCVIACASAETMQCIVSQYVTGMSHSDVMLAASTETSCSSPLFGRKWSGAKTKTTYLRNINRIAGLCTRRRCGEAFEYIVKEVLLNGECVSDTFRMTTPLVGPDVAMHFFMAALDPDEMMRINPAEAPSLIVLT